MGQPYKLHCSCGTPTLSLVYPFFTECGISQDSPDSDKFLPCYDYKSSSMPGALRAKAIQAVVEAVRKHDGHYVKNKFDAEESGDWSSVAEQGGAEVTVSFTLYNNNVLFLRMGDWKFALWQQCTN